LSVFLISVFLTFVEPTWLSTMGLIMGGLPLCTAVRNLAVTGGKGAGHEMVRAAASDAGLREQCAEVDFEARQDGIGGQRHFAATFARGVSWTVHIDGPALRVDYPEQPDARSQVELHLFQYAACPVAG
jgi:hypothetical protein